MNPARAPRPTPAAPPAGSLAGLGNRFVSLFARRLPRQAFAAEVARIVLPALHAAGVAILGYEQRRDRLVLLAGEGLNKDALIALGNGDTCSWDIPMRGLRNRRISIIAGAHNNPFVPRALANIAPRGLSIASLPIHHDLEPAGIMLVFIAGGRAFTDQQLQTLSQALRVCAPGIHDTESRSRPVLAAAQPENVEATIAKLVAAGAIIDPAAASAALAPAPREPAAAPAPGSANDDLVTRVQSLERELAKAHEELDASSRRLRQFTVNNNALSRERDGLEQRLAELESGHGSAVNELRAELMATQERLLAVEAERARLVRLSENRFNASQQSLSTLEQERNSLETRASNAEANVAELQTLLAAVFDERDRLNAQIETLSGELRLRQESLQRYQGDTVQERTALEADRDGWKEEAASARSQLAERTGQLATIERELRSAVVARDGLQAQLSSARAELERVAALSEEQSLNASQVETARAAVAGENAVLRRNLENERAERLEAEAQLRSQLATAESQVEHLSGSTDSVRSELAERLRMLAERDAQLAALRQQYESARQSATQAQDNANSLRAEMSTLGAQLEHTELERRQLLDERNVLRGNVGEMRQRLTDAEVGRASAVGELQAQVDTLQRQLQGLGSERSTLSERLERSLAEGHELKRRLTESQQRGDELSELVRERDLRLAELSNQHEHLTARSAALEGQWHAAQEALERQQTRAAHERSSFESQRANWEEHAAAVQGELTQRTETMLQLEHDLRSAVVVRETALQELEDLQQDRGRLAAQVEGLRGELAQREADRDAAAANAAALRASLEQERSTRSEAEQRWRGELTAARAELERWSNGASGLRKELDEQIAALGDRESQINDLQREIETLRQQAADRDVLASQASSLGAQIVELEKQLAVVRAEAARAQDQTASEWEERLVALEQELAAVRGEASQAERQRAGVAQELEAARRMQAQVEVIHDRKLAQLRDAVDRLTEERRRLESTLAERSAAVEAQRAGLADLQNAMDQLRAERGDAHTRGEDLAQQLGEAHRRLEQLAGHLRDRESALDVAVAERSKISGQVTKLAAQLRASQEALETMQGRAALDRAALEADRERWKEQSERSRSELERLLSSADAATQNVAEISAAKSAAEAEVAALRRSLENDRTAHRDIESTLRSELTAARNSNAQMGEEMGSLRSELGERDTRLAALQAEYESAHQAFSALQHNHGSARTELEAALARLEEAGRELQSVRDDSRRLEAQIATLQASQGEEVQGLGQQLQATRTQLRAIEHEKGMLESQLGEHQQRIRELAAAHAASVGEMQSAVADLRKQIVELTAGRVQLLQRAERAEQALTLRDRELSDDVQQRSMLGERCSALEQQLANVESRRAELDAELARARSEAEALRADSADRGALAEHSSELARRMAELEQQVSGLHGEVTRSERQRSALAEELEAAHTLRANLVQAAEGEQNRLRERLQQLTEERKLVEALQVQQQAELESNRAQLAELRGGIDHDREERLQLEQSHHELEQKLADTQRKLDDLSSHLRERESALELAAADRKRLQEAVRAAETTAEILAAERESAGVPASPEDLNLLPIGDDDSDLVIERSAPLDEEDAEIAEPADLQIEPSVTVEVVAEPARELFLLDTGKRAEEASAALRAAGFEVQVAGPIEASVDELRRHSLGCVMLNLAAGPQAWRTLKALREDEATRSTPVLAYLMPPDGQKGFCFGRADFGFWPIDPEQLLMRLHGLRPKLKRLLAVSADVDGMGKLREPLNKANISTSIVLDGKQALEFTTIVAPEAAVLHLSPQTPAVARAIGGIRQQESTVDLPLLLLLDKAPPREEVFMAATVRELLIKGTFTFNKLPAEIAHVIA